MLLLTVPDDMLDNVVTQLAAQRRHPRGPVVVHTCGRHGLRCSSRADRVGARPVALHPAMTFTGTALDLDRLAGCVFGVTAGPASARLAEARRPSSAAR